MAEMPSTLILYALAYEKGDVSEIMTIGAAQLDPDGKGFRVALGKDKQWPSACSVVARPALHSDGPFWEQNVPGFPYQQYGLQSEGDFHWRRHRR